MASAAHCLPEGSQEAFPRVLQAGTTPGWRLTALLTRLQAVLGTSAGVSGKREVPRSFGVLASPGIVPVAHPPPQGWICPRRMKLPKPQPGKREPPYPLLHPAEWDPQGDTRPRETTHWHRFSAARGVRAGQGEPHVLPLAGPPLPQDHRDFAEFPRGPSHTGCWG